MIRLFTKNATGVAPDGRWYAGDINALEDAVAASDDLTQIIKLATLVIGESGLQLLRYGALEARLTGALRVDTILRALGGLVPGAFTTTERNAIAPGSRPYGMAILNVTTNQWEWNKGSDAVPNWQPMTPVIAAGSIGTTELADDSVTAAKIAANAVGASEILDGSVGTAELGADSVTGAKIAPGHGGADDYGTVLPTTGLFNGYKFALFVSDPVAGSLLWPCVYRADLDGTRPWHVAASPIVQFGSASVHTTAAFNSIATVLTFTAPKNGVYGYAYDMSFGSNGSTPEHRITVAGSVGGFTTIIFYGRATLTAGQTIVIEHSNDFNNISLSDTSEWGALTIYPQKIV